MALDGGPPVQDAGGLPPHGRGRDAARPLRYRDAERPRTQHPALRGRERRRVRRGEAREDGDGVGARGEENAVLPLRLEPLEPVQAAPLPVEEAPGPAPQPGRRGAQGKGCARRTSATSRTAAGRGAEEVDAPGGSPPPPPRKETETGEAHKGRQQTDESGDAGGPVAPDATVVRLELGKVVVGSVVSPVPAGLFPRVYLPTWGSPHSRLDRVTVKVLLSMSFFLEQKTERFRDN